MPLRSNVVGRPLPSMTLPVTARMVLAFSAAIGEETEAAFDDAAPTFAASPMFCAPLEWRLVVAARNALLGVTSAEARRAVHAGQDSRFLRPLRPGGAVEVAGEIVNVRQTRAGALSTTRLDITELRTGALLSTTVSTALYRGVPVEGEDRSANLQVDAPVVTGEPVDIVETTVPLDRGFAHRYSECTAIWNPIHTERVIALEAGLPDIIVHGTALWALAGRTLIACFAPTQPLRMRRLSGRFSGMVVAGTPITVRHARLAALPGRAIFSLLSAEGKEAVSEGVADFVQA